MAEQSKSSNEQESAERSSDARSADFAVICSQKTEVKPLLKLVDRQRKYTDGGLTFRGGFIDHTLRIVVVEAGFDYAAHRRAAEIVINEHHPKWVMSVGFSIGLSEVVKTGDVCLANEISDVHGHDLALDLPLESGKRVHCGKHVVMDGLTMTAAELEALAQTSCADAADFVSLAVAQVCNQKTKDDVAANFLSIRSALSRRDASVTESLLKAAFRVPDEAPKQPVMQWLAKLRPDPIRRDALKHLEQLSINANKYLLQVIRMLGEKLTENRW